MPTPEIPAGPPAIPPGDVANPYAAPPSDIKPKAGIGRLFGHRVAGRVIRLFGVLGGVFAIAKGISIVWLLMTMGKTVPLILLTVPAFTLALSMGMFFTGRAVMAHKPWGRVVGLAYAAITLTSFPIGTMLSLYIFGSLAFKWNTSSAD